MMKLVFSYEYNKKPEYQTEHSSCFDIYSNISKEESLEKEEKIPFIVLKPLERRLVRTGVRIDHINSKNIENMIIQLVPRSGLAFKYGVTILNSPGIIDPDYKEEINVILYNSDPNNVFKLNHMERIAQILVFERSEPKNIYLRKSNESLISNLYMDKKKKERKGGFGSTGYK